MRDAEGAAEVRVRPGLPRREERQGRRPRVRHRRPQLPQRMPPHEAGVPPRKHLPASGLQRIMSK